MQKLLSKSKITGQSRLSKVESLVVEDGPTLTHGEMKIGASTVAAERFGAKELVDPVLIL